MAPCAGPAAPSPHRVAGGPVLNRPTARIRARGRAELEVKRSRFIATLAPVGSEAEARAVVAGVRGEFHEARHHCSAWQLGLDVPNTHSSDDGEPAGTAGVPMLGVLLRAGLTDTVAVVTRYFGGVLLGAGGLARAYGAAVGQAVDAIGTVAYRRVLPAVVDVDPAGAGRLEHTLRTLGLEPRTTWSAHGARFEVEVDPAEAAGLTERVAAATGGAARVRLGAPRWA